jgi:hypothetical protein
MNAPHPALSHRGEREMQKRLRITPSPVWERVGAREDV